MNNCFALIPKASYPGAPFVRGCLVWDRDGWHGGDTATVRHTTHSCLQFTHYGCLFSMTSQRWSVQGLRNVFKVSVVHVSKESSMYVFLGLCNWPLVFASKFEIWFTTRPFKDRNKKLHFDDWRIVHMVFFNEKKKQPLETFFSPHSACSYIWTN